MTDRRRAEYNGDNKNYDRKNINETKNPLFKNFQIDHRNKCVILKGHQIFLTPREFELVELLSTDIDRIFTSDEIINHLWPENDRATKADLYQYMHLLRKKLENDPNNPQWLMNVKGFGYKLNMTQANKGGDGGLAMQ